VFLKIIACEISFREICMAAARSVNQVDFEFLSQGYHDNPCIGLSRIQERVDAVEEGKFDAILVGYGLCNNMLVGLTARHTPLVIPRAHDCITFFLGSKERYQEYFMAHPGTYYYNSGWLEHRKRGGERVPRTQSSGLGPQKTYQELVEQYGEDNAKYLIEIMDGWVQNYTHGVFINFDFTRGLSLADQVKEICKERNWTYEEVEGNLGLLERWLDGKWDEEDFLIVKPGESVQASFDDKIIGCRRDGKM